MDLSLQGKNALICGSSKGIGKASAIELALLGANVTLVSRSGDLLARVQGELDKSSNQRHDFLVADFQNHAELKKKIAGLCANKRIDILVNNTAGPKGGPILNAKPEEFISGIEKHLICNHLLSQAVIPGMKKAGFGRIINIISTSVKAPIPGLGVSNTVRGAVASWAKTLANELAEFGITVNNVLPGFTETSRLEEIIEARAKNNNVSTEVISQQMKSIVPAKRFANPREIGAGVAFLASPAAGYITGINLPIDGGRTKSL